MSGRLRAAHERIERVGDFQYQNIAGEPIDDPLAAMTARESEGGKPYARFAFACPRTGKPCGPAGIVIGHPDKPAHSPSWHWDGNVGAPTLTPSVNCLSGGQCWHGWVRSGTFTE